MEPKGIGSSHCIHNMEGGGVPLPGAGTLTSPNPENKLFVGGAPPGTDESVLQQVHALARRACP